MRAIGRPQDPRPYGDFGSAERDSADDTAPDESCPSPATRNVISSTAVRTTVVGALGELPAA